MTTAPVIWNTNPKKDERLWLKGVQTRAQRMLKNGATLDETQAWVNFQFEVYQPETLVRAHIFLGPRWDVWERYDDKQTKAAE